MRVATKTLAAIDAALQADQGAKFRGLLRGLMPLAEDAYRDAEDSFRTHLGASLIGRECAREIWYGWHWVTKPKFEGRILRLFNRGHLEEPRFVALLQMIGCQVWQYDENGKQFRISDHRGHYGGSLDGVVRGLPDLDPDTPALTEFKTHNDKSFAKLVAEGVQSAKLEHYVQMQQYMGKYGLRWALYLAVNKNDDTIHGELVEFNSATYTRFLDRAGMIINQQEPPPRINNSPGWFKCKFCDHSPVCHGPTLPERNCRTCAHSAPGEDGQWVCRSPAQIGKAEAQCWEDPIVIGKESQLLGCEDYELNPTIKAKG